MSGHCRGAGWEDLEGLPRPCSLAPAGTPSPLGPSLLCLGAGLWHDPPPGAVYVCTEDAFPTRRLQQLIHQQQRLRTDVPKDVVSKISFGDHIFIEHVADVVSAVSIPTRDVAVRAG